MREKLYQMDELTRARELQDEAAKLHIPVPVLSYQYEIKDINGNIEEKGIGKSNSYTRNALNSIAWFAGLCSKSVNSNSVFSDGYVSGRAYIGFMSSVNFRRDSSVEPVVVLGIGTNAESLDDYSITSSDLTGGAGSVSSVFNSTTRKMITTISKSFINNTGSSIDITESGVTLDLGSGGYTTLFIRDVFTAVSVAAGQTITWTYVTEVAYPNP